MLNATFGQMDEIHGHLAKVICTAKPDISPTDIRYLIYTVEAGLLLLFCYLVYRFVYTPCFCDYLLAEKCRFRLQNTEPLKIGTDVTYTISGFLPPVILEEGNRQTNQINTYTQKFFNSLSAKVTVNQERVPAMMAYAEEEYGRIKMLFTVKKSGTYEMDIRYNGFTIPGSPTEITVPPDYMCSLRSEVKYPSTPVIVTDGMPQTIQITPKDRTGYPCASEGVRLDKFDFHCSGDRACLHEHCGKVCELIGGNWKEGLDAGFTYGGTCFGADSPDDPVTIKLCIRTNGSPLCYGVFEGQICYDGVILAGGIFPIVSLNKNEYERLEPTMREPKSIDVIQLKAQLLRPSTVVDTSTDNNNNVSPSVTGATTISTPINRETAAGAGFMDWCLPEHKPIFLEGQDVHINVSMKFICVKEVVWTVLLSRTALFSIQGGMKIEIIPETEEKKKYMVTLSDDIQDVRVLMSASNTRMLMALFYKFRSVNPGEHCKLLSTDSTLTFSEKLENFFNMLDSHTRRQMSFLGNRDVFQLFNISRPDVLRTSYEETKCFDKESWCSPFITSFIGEPLQEDDMSWLEWSELLLETVFENNTLGMFHVLSDRTGFIHPNPSRNHRHYPIHYYELAGKVVGKYLVARAKDTRSLNYRLKVRLSRSFLVQLIGASPTICTLERDIPELYESTVRTLTRNNLDEGMLTFCVPVYDMHGKLDQMIPIIENGLQTLVTNENADLYLNSLARYHLSSKVSRELSAFRAGFTFMVPEDFLLNFDENELELLMCGWSKLEVSELKKHHTTIGENWHPEFPRIIKWFWAALGSLVSVDQARFLQFATGSSILPEGGFAQLQPKVMISMTCMYGQLPVADPTTHSICLSDHPHFEAFNGALLAALRTSPCCQDRPKACECCEHEHGGDISNLDTPPHPQVEGFGSSLPPSFLINE